MKQLFPSLAAFFSGFILMAYEIVGARLVGPYLGSSVYVWTSIIGVIMVSLSIGYVIGGKRADRGASERSVAYLYLFIAVAIIITILLESWILSLLQISSLGLRTAPLLASFVLFAPASILLGIVHPIITRLEITTLDTSGRSVAQINALSTIGSIVGTFAAGYVFVPFLGTSETLFLLATCAIGIAILQPLYALRAASIAVGIVILVFIATLSVIRTAQEDSGFYTYETLYATSYVYDYKDVENEKQVRQLSIDGNNSSSQFVGEYTLRQNYLRFYQHLANHYAPSQDKTLLLGGAGYIYPSYFVRAFPERTMHVVEIDPELTDITEKHFDPEIYTHPNISIYHEDARTYLMHTEEKYDVILGDVFRSNLTIPFHLATREALIAKYSALTDNGIVIENVGASISGKAHNTLEAIYTTYKDVFPTVHLYPVKEPGNPDRYQNIMLVASKQPEPDISYITDEATTESLTHHWPEELTPGIILTDNHAPLAYLTAKSWD